MPSTTSGSKVALDLADHNGLRGIAAVWIMLFHCFLYSHLEWNFQGSTLMPLFFMLSGFSLSVGYHLRFNSQTEIGATQGSPVAQQHHNWPAVEYSSLASEFEGHNNDIEIPELNKTRTPGAETVTKPINIKKPSSLSPVGQYIYNRFIRVMPMFYITLALAIPITISGFGSFDPHNQFTFIASIVQNIIPTYTWTFYLLGVSINGPGWTICTLWFFWLLFPWMQKYFEKQTDAELLHTVVRCFWIQLSIGLVFFVVIVIITGNGLAAFWWATGVPYSRLPVFIMGMCAGILSSRHATSDTMPWFAGSGTFIPWVFWCFWSCPGCVCCSPDSVCCLGSLTSTTVDFKRTCTHQAAKLLVLTVGLSLICILMGDVGSNWWFQMVNVFAQLDFFVALTRAKGTTISSAVLRAPIVQWLGELSMSIYLVHFPLIYYLCWILHGKSVSWPSSFDCSTYGDDGSADQLNCFREYDTWRDARLMPAWGILVVPPAALLAAACLYYGVEEPVRNYFK